MTTELVYNAFDVLSSRVTSTGFSGFSEQMVDLSVESSIGYIHPYIYIYIYIYMGIYIYIYIEREEKTNLRSQRTLGFL